MELPLPLPEPKPTEAAVYLLHPEQIAWVRSHAGRNASLFMRRLIAQLMADERQEVARLQRKLRQGESVLSTGGRYPAGESTEACADGIGRRAVVLEQEPETRRLAGLQHHRQSAA